MRLENRNFTEESRVCKLCGSGVEDLEHFMLECERLESVRGEMIELRRPRLEDVEFVMGQLLFGEDIDGRRRWLCRMWKHTERGSREMEQE